MAFSSRIPDADILRQVAERSLSAFFVFNLQSRRFDYLNEAFFEIWPFDEGRINDQLLPLVASVHEDDRDLVHQTYQHLLNGAMRQAAEFRILGKSKQIKWVHATAYMILQNGQRQLVCGFAEDITHYKDNEVTLNLYSVQKNSILEMLAHDLNGPLGIVQKLAGQLEKKALDRGQPDLEHEAALIGNTVGHSIQMIHELLEKEYLDSSQAGLKIQRIELIEQLRFTLEGFKRMDQDGHKHFELESSAPEVYAEVDQAKFMQVITNLISNANKFTPKGGHIRINVQQEPGSLLISVRDDGVGIPKPLQPVLFDRFTKARRPGLQGEETTGLGLSIVKRVVELHQGKVWVESEENQGATFFIRIPYRPS
jgi:two-component system sensor histidine kinase VicK